MFRFLHRLMKQLSVSHKPFLINTVDFVAVIFVASILSMIFKGWLGKDVNGIPVNYAEAMVAGEPALIVALAHSRNLLLVATDPLHNGTPQVAVELDGADSMSGIWRDSSHTRLSNPELWLLGGLAEN